MSERCFKCGGPIPPDGIGLNLKLINRGIRQFLCMDCLADRFHLTIHELEVMADHFRDAGCTLFTPKQTAKNETKESKR